MLSHIVIIAASIACLFAQLEWNYYPRGAAFFHKVTGPLQPVVNDDYLVKQVVNELHNINGATDLHECLTCKLRLHVGKILALTRPDLVPVVFLTWCTDEGFDSTSCANHFGYPSVENQTLGNDFTVMLQNMQPEGLDGDLFCYYHDDTCHVLPELPDLNLSRLWPPKPRLYDAPKPQGETFNVLHLSDVNLQLGYTTLAESNCTQATCCLPSSYNRHSPPKEYGYLALFDPDFGLSFYESSYESGHFQKGPHIDQYKSFKPVWLPAHEFGAYTCGTSELLLNNTLQNIRDFHENHLNFEFGIFSGGINDPSSEVDKQTAMLTQYVGYNDIHHYLNFPILSTFGTGDTFPLHQFPMESLEVAQNYDWQFDFLSDLWHDFDWIDDDAAKEVRYNKVGYSMTTYRGLKVITLNSNVWNTQNLYGFVGSLNFDPFGVWKFLIDELIESEINEQRVWIISHLPLSSHALPIPTQVFTKIIERFSPKVIAAIFFGYDLKDGFNLIYGGDGTNKDLANLVNHALTGPSLSPKNGQNPAWRYYSVDTESFDIVNSFTYYTKLNETFVNYGSEPVWEFGYSARQEYDPELLWLSDRALDSEFWHHVAEKIRDIPRINKLYTANEFRHSQFDPYYYLTRSGENIDNSSVIVDNDNYCKVTSSTVMNRKECMLTEDQDNYIEPTYEKTYIPVIKPYQSPEYMLLQEQKLTEEQGSYIANNLLKPDTSTQKVKHSNEVTKSGKKASIRDQIHQQSNKIKQALSKRHLIGL